MTEFTSVSAYKSSKKRLEVLQKALRKKDGEDHKFSDLFEEAVIELENKYLFENSVTVDSNLQEAMQFIQELLKKSDPILSINIYKELDELDHNLIKDVLSECAAEIDTSIMGSYLVHLSRLFENFRILTNYISTFSKETVKKLKGAKLNARR